MLQHARALAAMCAPTVNSYKRLVVGRALSGATWAPAYIAYGDNNRTACVRIPGGRLEIAPAGLPAAIPYLAPAAVLAAGLDGVERKLDPGEPNNTNLYELSPAQLARAQASALLPQNLLEAIDALEADAVVRDALGAGTWRRSSSRSSAWSGSSTRATCPTGKRSATWSSSDVRNRRIAAQEAALRDRLGELMVPMLIGMTERGPDSAGLAVFTEPSERRAQVQPVLRRRGASDWKRLRTRARIGASKASIDSASRANHAMLTTPRRPMSVKAWLAEAPLRAHVLSVGRSHRSLQGHGRRRRSRSATGSRRSRHPRGRHTRAWPPSRR